MKKTVESIYKEYYIYGFNGYWRRFIVLRALIKKIFFSGFDDVSINVKCFRKEQRS